MPDRTGKLDAEDIKKCAQWINDHQPGDVVCPICGTVHWLFGEDIVEMRAYSGGGITLGAPVYPQIQMICINCGHTLFINAVIAGILTPPKAQPAAKEGGNG